MATYIKRNLKDQYLDTFPNICFFLKSEFGRNIEYSYVGHADIATSIIVYALGSRNLRTPSGYTAA